MLELELHDPVGGLGGGAASADAAPVPHLGGCCDPLPSFAAPALGEGGGGGG